MDTSDTGGKDVIRIKVVRGPAEGKEFLLNRSDVTIGRSPDTDISLPDDQMSAKHARIIRENSEYYLEDLGSDSGSLLDGCRISKKVRLQKRSTFELARTTLEFDIISIPAPLLQDLKKTIHT